MHPILGTMMPKICEAPHLRTSCFQPSCSTELNEWEAFISFAHAEPIDVKEQGVIWLLASYNWSIRNIARKLALSLSVIAR